MPKQIIKAAKPSKATPAKQAAKSIKASKPTKASTAIAETRATEKQAAKLAAIAARTHKIDGGCTYKRLSLANDSNARVTGNFLGAKKHSPVNMHKNASGISDRDHCLVYDLFRTYGTKQFKRLDIDAGTGGRSNTLALIAPTEATFDTASIDMLWSLTKAGRDIGAKTPTVSKR